jgi:integrase
MTCIRLDYVHEFTDRHGKLRRRYFRRSGHKRVPLPGVPGSDEFMEAYQAALAGAPKIEIGAGRSKPGTVNAVLPAFYSSIHFTEGKNGPRREITKQTDRNLLEAFRVKHGDKRLAMLQQHHIEAIIAEKAGPAAKRNLLRVIRALMTFCVATGIRRDNPALGIKLARLKTQGFHSWTEAELQQYEARHPVGSKARLALHLILYTLERRKDAAAVGPQNLYTMPDGSQRLRFKPSKDDDDGSPLDIPVFPQLAATIAATPVTGTKSFIVTDYGNPFTAGGFGNKMREWCDQANLPHCSAHGLRKAGMRRMAESGCSEDYIASISGHTDMRIIRQYVRAANKAKMADAAMAKVLAMFP